MLILRRALARLLYGSRECSGVENLISPATGSPAPASDIRIIYQPYALTGACGFIDRGMVDGYGQLGAQVAIWDCTFDNPPLGALLNDFRPTHFVGYMQKPSRANFRWTSRIFVHKLLRYKARRGLKFIANTSPSNLRAFYGDWLDQMRDVRTSFYDEVERPNRWERRALQSGLVDLLTARDSTASIPVLYRDFLEMGAPVISEPPAFDDVLYAKYLREPCPEEGIDVLFIGHSWPFKLANMKSYVDALRERLGDRFVIFGGGWPEGYAQSVLEPREGYDAFALRSMRAAINIGFHEPSQVLTAGSSTNERVFKLLGLGRFVVSDPCGALRDHFEDGVHLRFARDSGDMVGLVEEYLDCPEKRRAIASRGQELVLAEHTYRVRAQRTLQAVGDLK